MDIWLDTTNMRTVQKAVRFGLLSGVTTNPTLIAKAQHDLEEVLEDLLHYQEGPVAVQVVADEASQMLQQGQTLYSLSNRLIIKVPVTENGLEAIHLLSRQGIPTMATAVYHPHQVLMASLAGANFAAPYLGRIKKEGSDPWDLLKKSVHLLQMYHLETKILGASLLDVEYVMQCAEIGIYGVTVKDELFDELIESSPLTLKNVKEFANDWKNVNTPLFAT
jgi:TalC/MipB family fructose-6-phosphate aldolase